MRSFALCLLLAITALSMADCGCGAKCAIYSDASKCTRCCTATVKRSLSRSTPPRSHRFLLPPQLGNPIRIPMWLAAAASSYSSSSSSSASAASAASSQKHSLLPASRHRRHRRVSRRLLDQILSESMDRNI
ncbi:hypothetical protein GCK32_008527 [Trichostrongylus colubriformis]|uniref:Uncharacterized protein n=1 Tax=Trichostrongylus colubriformis TaxID=6319 RepID=A0AAN8IDN9_TRICO